MQDLKDTMEYKDYYEILGVPKSADDKEIKKAYRKLARQYHPDANPGDATAEERFKAINEAHEVLSDPDKRQKYDQFGSQWSNYSRGGGGNVDDFVRQWGGGQRGGGQPGGGTHTRNVSPEEFEQMFGGGMGGFSDFFESLFAGAGRTGGGFDPYGTRATSYPRSSKGRDIEQPVEITLEEAYHGATRLLQQESGRLEISIPRGVKTGSRVRVAGKGAPGADGGPAGDFYLRVQVLPHATFTREGDDLREKVPIDIYTLMLGGEAHIPTLDRTLALTVPAGTPNGKTFRLRGQGMPNMRNPEQRGDLYATIDAQLPQELSEQEQDLVRQLQTLRVSD